MLLDNVYSLINNENVVFCLQKVGKVTYFYVTDKGLASPACSDMQQTVTS